MYFSILMDPFGNTGNGYPHKFQPLQDCGPRHGHRQQFGAGRHHGHRWQAVQAFQIWMGPTALSQGSNLAPCGGSAGATDLNTDSGCGRAMDRQLVPSHGLGPDVSIVPGSTVGPDLYNPRGSGDAWAPTWPPTPWVFWCVFFMFIYFLIDFY